MILSCSVANVSVGLRISIYSSVPSISCLLISALESKTLLTLNELKTDLFPGLVDLRSLFSFESIPIGLRSLLTFCFLPLRHLKSILTSLIDKNSNTKGDMRHFGNLIDTIEHPSFDVTNISFDILLAQMLENEDTSWLLIFSDMTLSASLQLR